MLLTALKEGGLQWLVVNTQHDEQSDPWPGTKQSGSMYTDAEKGALQDY